MIPARNILLILTSLPDAASAEDLAKSLVGGGLAACVNILTPCRSIYRWQGRVETAEEIPLLIKTHAGRYQAVEAAIRARHPYEVPEIIAFSTHTGLADYLNWVLADGNVLADGDVLADGNVLAGDVPLHAGEMP
jgi:periplasmic divalent cation tolerance protein